MVAKKTILWFSLFRKLTEKTVSKRDTYWEVRNTLYTAVMTVWEVKVTMHVTSLVDSFTNP